MSRLFDLVCTSSLYSVCRLRGKRDGALLLGKCWLVLSVSVWSIYTKGKAAVQATRNGRLSCSSYIHRIFLFTEMLCSISKRCTPECSVVPSVNSWKITSPIVKTLKVLEIASRFKSGSVSVWCQFMARIAHRQRSYCQSVSRSGARCWLSASGAVHESVYYCHWLRAWTSPRVDWT